LGRPAKKRKYAEAKAERKGQLQAELEYKRKSEIKNLEDLPIIKNPIGTITGMVEKEIDHIGWIEAGAIGIGTVIIHGLVASDKNLTTHIIQTFSSATLGLGPWGIASWLTQEAIMKVIPSESKKIPDWELWAASFFCAYIICKYAGQLVGLLEKGLGNVVPMLLGVA
jgi:hypothetical protein